MAEKSKSLSPSIIRLIVSSVFLWFGINQILDAPAWVAWLPPWVVQLPFAAEQFVLMNGVFEVVLGILLVVGRWTRGVALLLGLHLLGIAFIIGYNDIGIRDAALGLITLSVALHGPDSWTWDERRNNR